MSDAQTWTLIVGTLTTQVGIVVIAFTFQWRAFRAEIGRLDARFDAVDARFDAVLSRLDHLDRDVSELVRREMDR